MSKLFNWAAARLVAAFALALCFATPLVSWADAITAVNPVTGETETYTWKFTGTDAWNSTNVWEDLDGNHPSGVPAKTDNNRWEPLLINGNYTISTLGSWTIEGWNLRMGFYNGANVSLGKLNKLQGSTTMWITVDEKSHFAVADYADGNFSDNQTLKFSVASANGITWSDTFACNNTDNNTIEYYLKGAGSVSFQALNAGTHRIKMADVALSGNEKSVQSKTLVSFTSTDKTFTADAAIKVKNGDNVLKTVYLTSVTAGATTLTAESDVGTCELVQTSTGIVLYYVDGDPADVNVEEKTYKPSISVNFTSGTALSTHADVGVGDYAIPGTSWNNLIGNNGTLSTVTQVDSTGAASTVAGVGVTISGTRGYWTCGSVSAETDLRQGYIDDADGVNASPQVVVSGIPYYSYYAVVYFSNNDANVPFGYVTINGTNYKWDSENSELVECEGTSSDSWGASSPTAWTEGGNYIVTPTIVNADGTFTVVGHRVTGARAGIAAIQIVEVPKTAEEGELVINVSGDKTYTVSEDATYTTVYVTGAGTLAFDGEGAITTTTLNVGAGATVPMGSSITPNTVVGAGTVVYDGVQPSTTVGFDNSASWFGTVWVKNVGDTSKGEATDAKVTTRLGSDTTDATSNELNKWGNANSFVKFTNVRAFMAKADVPWTLVLEDDDTNYAWYNNQGWTARSITIAGLKGDGTFWDINDGGCRPYLNFGDASQFTGTIKALGKQVFLNDTTNTGDATSGLAGRITVPANQTLTVASGKTWHTSNGLVVNGTLNVNGTLASDSTTAAVRGSGTVVFTGSAPSPTGDAWWKNSAWTGTVELNAATAIAGWEFNNYGHSGSTLRLNNCRGWLKANYTCIPALEIGGTFTWNDGSSGLGNTFKVGTLKGSGTISIPTGGAPTAVWQITDDWSGFTGAVVGNNTDGRRVLVFGPTLPATVEAGEIYVSDGATLNLGNASATWWTLGKGFVVDGTVVSPNRDKWGGGTAMTLGDTGVLELTSTANTQDYKDYSGVTGTGTIKYSSTAGWRLFPDTSAKMPATTLTIQTELADSLIIACTNDTVIGNLAGTKNIRSDWGDNSANGRTLTVTQSKDTEWSGKFVSNRITQFNVNLGASTTGTLTLSGTQTVTVPAAINGSVNLTGTWVGATTVAGTFGGTGTLTGNLTFAEGSTFKAFAADDEDGLVVSGTVGYPAEGTVTVDVSAIEPETDVALLKAAGLNRDNFALADGTPEGYSLEVVDGVLTLTVPHVTITVPSIANTTVTVKIGDNTIGTSSGDYNVAPDSMVTVTYVAVDGYEISGTTEYTIDTSKSETTFDPAGTTEVKQYVASITVGETTTKYTTLQAAIDAVAQNKDIVLLANEADGATVSREITFNVVPGEYTYGDIAAGGDYILTTTALEGKTRYSLAPAVIAVTINDVRTPYSMINAPSGIEAANAGPIGTTIEILSGNPADYAEHLPMFDLNVETGVFTKVTDPVAAIYNGVIQVQVYRTLADAVSAAENGQMVKLLADVTLDASLAIPAGKSLTLNLNGYTLTGPSGKNYAIANSGNITLTGGTITGYGVARNVASGATITVTDGTYTATGANGFINLTDTVGCAVTINGGTFTAQEAVVATGRSKNSSITVNGGTLTSIDNAVLMDNGSSGYTGNTITVTGGTLNGGITTAGYVACGIYCANDTTVNVTGGTFNITGGCGILARAGKVSVSGTTVINTTGTATGKVGDSRVVVPCAPIVYDSAANYPGYDETTTEFAVSGGTFTADGQDVDCIVQVADEGDATSIAVSGGTFNTAVADTYCAEGFEPKDNGDGTYGVRVDKGWVYAAPGYWDYTGTWTEGAALGDDKVTISDGATYSNRTASAGQLVTVAMTLSFDDVNDDDSDFGDAKAAIRLAAGETDGTYQFQLYTSDGANKVWTNATVVGVTATKEVDYNFVIVLDLTNKIYTASVVSGTTTNALTIGENVTEIPFACQGEVTPVQTIDFVGSGTVSSIEGSYEDAPEPEGFVENQVIGVVTLTSAQAAWLNGQGNYDALAAQIAEMDATAFNNAYLLNLDVTASNSDYTFAVKGIVVGEGKVDVTVTLTRDGALTENEKAKPIVGTLKLKGTAALGTDFTVLGETAVEFGANANFGDGATETTVTVDTTATDAKFYLPVIE